MARPIKGAEALSETLRVRVSGSVGQRIRREAIASSTPDKIVEPSDVVREALELGLEALEKRRQKAKR